MSAGRLGLFPAILVCLAMLVSGCAGKLEIYQKDRKGNVAQVKGIPFRVPVLHVVKSESREWIKNKCVVRSTEKFVSLPSEEVYYAFQSPGLFSGSKFVINLDEKGNVSGMSASSESKVSDATSLIKSIKDISGLFASDFTPVTVKAYTKETCKGQKIVKAIPVWKWVEEVNKP